jgi:hypothetical protein
MTDTTVEPLACEVPGTRSVERAFGWSMVVSGIRCTLTYVVLPFALPFVGLAPGVGPTIGLVVGTVALFANILSLRRFHRSSHPWRIPAMAIHTGVIGLLVVLLLIDGNALIS